MIEADAIIGIGIGSAITSLIVVISKFLGEQWHMSEEQRERKVILRQMDTLVRTAMQQPKHYETKAEIHVLREKLEALSRLTSR